MTDVPKGRDTKDRKTKEDQDRDWMNASNKPGNLVLLDKRPRKDSPLQVLVGAWTCQQFNFGLQDFSTVTE